MATDDAGTLRPLTAGALMAATSQIVVAATGAATTVAVARLLGPSGTGSFTVAQSLVLLLTMGTTLGVGHGIAYFVSSGAWAPRAAYRSAIKVSAVTGAVGAGVALAVRLLVPSAFAGLSVWLTVVAVAGVPFALAWLYASYVAVATDDYETYAVLPAAASVVALALAVPGAVLYGLSGAVVGTAAASVVMGAASWLWLTSRLRNGEGGDHRSQLRRAISFGFKGYAANALQLINYRLDLFILAAVTSSAVVGHYAVAVAATSVLWLLPGALAGVLLPRVAHLSARGDEPQRELVEAKSLRHVSLFTAATVVLMIAALELLLVPVFGSRFRPAIDLGLILLPGAAAIALSNVLAATVVGRGKPIYSLRVSLVTTPVTVALYATLIPLLHADGAALASTLSYLCNFGLFCHFYGRATGIRALPLLVPGRSELRDLLALPRAARSWAEGLLP